MSLKAKVEAIIYAAEEPITLEQIAQLLREVVLADLAAAKENAAIELADSAAEALAANPGAAPASQAAGATAAAAEETTLLPELVPASNELICPEAGPLMPQAAQQSESLEENNADEPLNHPAEEASEPPAVSASVRAPEAPSRKRQPARSEQEIAEDKAVRARIRAILVELVADYASEERGIEIRQVAGGFRMATKPEHHDVVRAFAKSLKPPIRLSLAALETLAVVAYKQPITGPEIAEIRGVESAGVLGTLLDRKLITTAGRKQVIGRPMQYKTSKDFLLRFGLNDVNELPSMEEFSLLAGSIEIAPPEAPQAPSLFEPDAAGAASSAAENTTAEPAVATAPYSTPDETKDPAPEEPARGPEELGVHEPGSQLPEPQEVAQQSEAAGAADSQPQSDAESNNVPEAEHPIGQ